MRNPIERLRDLLDEREKVAEKIAEVESALGAITRNISLSLARQSLNSSSGSFEVEEPLLKEEQDYGRLLQALRDMQGQIEERLRPMAEQVVQAEIERLLSLCEEQTAALGKCLERIDESIIDCRSRMEEYQQTRSNLVSLRERLSKLGAPADPLPDGLPGEDLRDVILARLERLQSQSKL